MVSSLQDEERGGGSSVNQCRPDGQVILAIRVIIYLLKMCLHLVEQRMMSVIRSCLLPTGSVMAGSLPLPTFTVRRLGELVGLPRRELETGERH